MTEGPSSEFKGALLGGLVATIGLFGGIVLVGNLASFEALRLIEATIPTGQFLASASVAAGATVLALMLTLIGLTVSSDLNFSDAHYNRIRNINVLATLVIVVAVVVLVTMAIPVGEVDEVRNYYAILYYILAAMLSVLGGLVVAMALMIGGTVRGLVDAAHPEGESDLVVSEKSEKDPIQS
jgi:hypothetical protein